MDGVEIAEAYRQGFNVSGQENSIGDRRGVDAHVVEEGLVDGEVLRPVSIQAYPAGGGY